MPTHTYPHYPADILCPHAHTYPCTLPCRYTLPTHTYPHYPADILCPHTHTHTTLQIYSVHTNIPTLPCRYTLTDLPVKCWPVMQLSLVTQQGRSHQRLLPLRRTPYSPLITLLWYVVIVVAFRDSSATHFHNNYLLYTVTHTAIPLYIL